jgi:hypothetical protein
MATRISAITLKTAAGPRRRRATALAVCVLLSVASAVALLLLSPDDRLLVAPMLVIGLTATAYILVLWARDGSPPVFEAGTLCMLAITVYGTLPMAGFLMMHGQWDPLADGRLQDYPFNISELGRFGWRYAAYGAAFAMTYAIVRGRAAVKTTRFTVPKQATQAALIILFIVLYACKIALKVVYAYDPDDFNYSDVESSVARGKEMIAHTPYFILQIAHNILGALFVVELGAMILLIANWRKRWCRYALVLWICYEIFFTIWTLGSRGRVVLLLISAAVLYHRLVKPLRFRLLIGGGMLLLAAFLVAGAIRMASSPESVKANVGHVLTGANEFQALFATAFDIHKRKEAGSIQSVPWQIYVSDLYYPVPSQLLPFEKIDPSSWYIDVIGQTGLGIGYMFGVMSQAAVGLDWIELVLRGMVLAIVLALLQRWYVRHATDFWATLFCLFVSIWAYYTFRASTFYFVYFVIYHFFPAMVATALLTHAVSRLDSHRAVSQVTVET